MVDPPSNKNIKCFVYFLYQERKILNEEFADLDIEGFDFDRYILGTYAKKDEALKRPLTVMKQDVWEQIMKVE